MRGLKLLAAAGAGALLLTLLVVSVYEKPSREPLPQAPAQLGYKDIYLGMPREALREVWEEGCSEAGHPDSPWCHEMWALPLPRRYRSLGSTLLDKVQLFLVDGKVGGFFLTFPHDDYQTLRVAFVEKYGPPKSRTLKTWKNRLGATFEGESLTREWADASIHAEEYGEQVTTGTISIASRIYLAHLEREGRKRAREAARDL